MGHDVNEKLTGDFYTKHFAPDLSEDGGTLILNIGPQHPATHGVLRVVVELDGEYIRKSEPVLGYIHRMHEKMGEVKTYPQYLPNMGRVDYLHALAWNWAYVGAVEKLMGIRVPPRAEYIRVITCELNRISSPPALVGGLPAGPGRLHPDPVRVCRPRADPGHPADRDRLAPDLLLLSASAGSLPTSPTNLSRSRGSSAGISPGGCPCTATW